MTQTSGLQAQAIGTLLAALAMVEDVQRQISHVNVTKKPWAWNPKVVGFIQGTLIKTQGFLIRFLHY